MLDERERLRAATRASSASIGTFNSGCAEIEIPIDNRAPNGPLAMVSPANTYVGLTHSGPGTAAGEPGKYYPTGKRNYARVVAADDFQGAADATLAQTARRQEAVRPERQGGLRRRASRRTRRTPRRSSGSRSSKDVAWDPKATSYAALALQIKASGAQAVFLGGLICENGGKLIKDIRSGAPNVTIIAPDGFTPISADVQQSGGKANGMYVSVAGLPNAKLPAAGKAFVKAFSASRTARPVDPYAVYAAQAAEVMVAAIAASDGTRAGVAGAAVQGQHPERHPRPIAFNANGDVSANPVTIYKVVGGKSTTYQVIVPTVKTPSSPVAPGRSGR